MQARIIAAAALLVAMAAGGTQAQEPGARRAVLVDGCVQYGEKALGANPVSVGAIKWALPDTDGRPNIAETTVGFIAACLESQRDTATAQALLTAVLDRQDLAPKSLTHGLFPWYDEKDRKPSADATRYIAPVLACALVAHKDALGSALATRVEAALRAAAKGLQAVPLPPNDDYRLLLEAASQAAIGRAVGDAVAVRRNVEQVRKWNQSVRQRGFWDGHSSTFDAVMIGTVQWVWWASDDAGKAEVAPALDLLYRDLAQRLQPGTNALAGSIQRAYPADYLVGGGVSQYLVYTALGGPSCAAVEPFAMFLVGPGYVPPADVVALARSDASRMVTTCGAGSVERTDTYITPQYSLGTSSGAVIANTIPIMAIYPGSGSALTSYAYVGGAPGRVASVQQGNLALVDVDFDNLGTPDRLKAWVEAVIAERANVDGVLVGSWQWNDKPSAVNELASVAIRTKQAYIGLTLLQTGPAGVKGETTRPKPGVLEWHGEGEHAQLTLRTYARQADYPLRKLEHNVRAGFVVELASLSEYESLEKFAAHVRRNKIKETYEAEKIRRRDLEEGRTPFDLLKPKSKLEQHFDFLLHHTIEYTGDGKVSLKLVEEMLGGRVERRYADGNPVWDDFLWKSLGLSVPVPGFVPPAEPAVPVPAPVKPAKPQKPEKPAQPAPK